MNHRHHCIFCSNNFIDELKPILGFATARACDACMKEFERQRDLNVKAIVREHCHREPEFSRENIERITYVPEVFPIQ